MAQGRRFVCVSEDELVALDFTRLEGETSQARERAHALILSSDGMSVTEIARIFAVSPRSVRRWFDRWEEHGLDGLADRPRCGRRRQIYGSDREVLVALIHQAPHNTKWVRRQFKIRTGKNISRSRFRQIAREEDLVYKRVRKTKEKEPDPEEYEERRETVVGLMGMHLQGQIELWFQDEAGFSREPVVTYGWQPAGETLCVPSSKYGTRFNVSGFLSLEGKFVSHVFPSAINSEAFCASMDAFCKSTSGKRAVVLDQASFHTSAMVEAKEKEWNKQGVYLIFLCPYSPELNFIEMLWREMKYHWLPLDAYESPAKFKKELFSLLEKIGVNPDFSLNFLKIYEEDNI